MKRVKKKTTKAPEEEFDFFEIDENNLVREWTNQPKLFFQHSVMLVSARKRSEQLKASISLINDDIKTIKAKLDLKIRRDPEKYNIPKITEPSVTAAILIQPCLERKEEEKRTLEKRLISVKYRIGILEAVVSTLEQRKSALQDLVRLHGQNYFSTPQVQGVDQETIDDMIKREARTKKKARR
jgi:hypothetical protein